MSSIPAAVERLTQRVKDRTGTLLRSPVVEDVANVLAELSRLEEANTILQQAALDRLEERKALPEENAKLRAERDEALEALKDVDHLALVISSAVRHSESDRAPENVTDTNAALKRVRSLISKGGADV